MVNDHNYTIGMFLMLMVGVFSPNISVLNLQEINKFLVYFAKSRMAC